MASRTTSSDTSPDTSSGQRAESIRRAQQFSQQFTAATVNQRTRLFSRAPLTDIQVAALHDPDPFARRFYLFLLDHYANDESMHVFSDALHDPVDFVRNIALHSIACEPCKSSDLCVADVTPSLIDALRHDRSADLRIKCIPLLMRLAGRDPRARAAVEQATTRDPDPIVRQTAADALAGRFIAPRKRYQRAQRRHGQKAS